MTLTPAQLRALQCVSEEKVRVSWTPTGLRYFTLSRPPRPRSNTYEVLEREGLIESVRRENHLGSYVVLTEKGRGELS